MTRSADDAVPQTSVPRPGEVTEWSSAAARLRRLQIAQLSALLAFVIVVSAAVVIATRAVGDLESRHETSSAALVDLGDARDDLRAVEVAYWRERTPGATVPVTLDSLRSIARARAGFVAAVESQAESHGRSSDSVVAGGEAIRRLDRLVGVAALGVGLQAGSAEEAAALERSDTLILSLNSAMDVWSEATRADQIRSDAELADSRRRMVLVAFAVAGLFGIAGVAFWVLLDRARQRVVGALVDATDEQLALRRVATSVMRGDPLADTLALVARELGALSGALVCEVVRTPPGPTRVALWSAPDFTAELGSGGLGTLNVLRPGDAVAPVRVSPVDPAEGMQARSLALAGVRLVAASPILAGGEVWGSIGIGIGDERFSRTVLERIERFAEMTAVVVEQDRGRARLSEEASTDHLTGLANHRVFHERLMAEVTAAHDEGTALSLVLIDLDDFRRVNDGLGHQVGDEVLAETARRLLRVARENDLVARIGGEEFAWLMPGTSGLGAFAVAERARQLIRARPLAAGATLTVSAGVCDLRRAPDAADLVRFADGALYWAKHHGRDLACLYSPETVHEISDAERADRLERLRGLEALRALARAVDARDPYTQRHSERVAELAHRIAMSLGWSEAKAESLREAGLMHDVGKIGVPDAILLKPGLLDAREYAQVRRHAELGAQIVADVLSPEATSWVRGHHERIDGRGYPDGLVGDAIPEGARILALADAWDAMTTDRPYHRALGSEAALAECRESAGTHLWEPAVVALELLMAGDRVAAADQSDDDPSPGWTSPVS